MKSPVRVLVVDDSAVMRKLIPQLLQGDPSIQVVGTAMDGLLGLKKIGELHPDVITLDLEMPRMDGIEMLREIVRRYDVPVIVVSGHGEKSAYSALNALSLGAFDFVAKPKDAKRGGMDQIARELAMKIKVAAVAGSPKHKFTGLEPPRKLLRTASGQTRPTRSIAIGVSTGGPNALHFVFSQIPADFSGCLVVVQHMPEGFTQMFARRLNDCSALEVSEARSGDMLAPGHAYICPGNRHIKVRRTEKGEMIVLADQPHVNGHRPSADVLFHSVAKELGAESVAILMTGMGEDGSEGMRAVQAAGGVTIAQSLETCVVDSMPRAAIEHGYAGRVVSLDVLPGVLQTLCAGERTRPRTDVTDLVTSRSTESGS